MAAGRAASSELVVPPAGHSLATVRQARFPFFHRPRLLVGEVCVTTDHSSYGGSRIPSATPYDQTDGFNKDVRTRVDT